MLKTDSSRKAFVSIAGCLLVQLCVGIIYLWSVLKTPFAAAFSMADSAAAMVSAYMLTGFVAGALLGGILVDKKGPRLTCTLGVILFSLGVGSSALLTAASASLIYVTYAALGGFGSGVAYSACISCIQKWMPGRRGLASGLAVSAFGLSTVIFAPVFRGLMNLCTAASGFVNFTAVFAILGGAFLALGLLGCSLIQTAPEGAAAGDAVPSMSLRQAVGTVPFWCILLTVFFINGAWNLATPLFYDLGIDRGLTPAMSTFAISLSGLFSAAGRLGMAAASDRLGRRPSICLLSLLTVAASLALMTVRDSGYIAAVALLAFAYGGPSSVNAAITTDYFGPKHSGSIYGVILLALGGSSLFFNAVSARFLNGDTAATFCMAALSAAVPLVLMATLKARELYPRTAAHVDRYLTAHRRDPVTGRL